MKIKGLFLTLIIIFGACCVQADALSPHWAQAEIERVQTLGIMTGGDGGFAPDRNITRAELVCAVIRAIKAEPSYSPSQFTDVADANIFAPYIARAVELGLVTGFSDGTFRPQSFITREEAAVVLSRAFGYLSGYSPSRRFSDYSQITRGAREAIGYALKTEVISGYPDNTIRPRGYLTRAEAACILLRSMNIEGNTPGFIMGYPTADNGGSYGNISVEIRTNMPCTVYYMLQSADIAGIPVGDAITEPLIRIDKANNSHTAEIRGEIGRVYTLSLIMLTPDGRRSNVVQLADVTPQPFKEGDGTAISPYSINTAAELDLVRFYPEKAFRLKKDITLSGEWEPIEEFCGLLDGAGHRIDGLYVNSDRSYQGLFGKVTGGELKNLTVNGSITAKANAGILGGELTGGTVRSCTVTGSVTAVTNNAGGFFGESSGELINSLSAVYLVDAGGFAGGIVGRNYGIIKNSMSAVHTVTARMYAGGISAVNTLGGRIEKSVSANINLYDMMWNNCGRITSNKKDSTLAGNFAYSGMRTNSENAVNEAEGDNGADIGWEELISQTALCDKLDWDKNSWTGGSKAEAYLLPHPSGSAVPVLKAGISEYAPVRIERASELLGMIDNPDMHFLLTKDISFNDSTRWSVAADTLDTEKGFSGTFDGNGHTIRGLKVTRSANGLCGLFGMISGGEVRNLRLNGTALIGGDTIGAIASFNYGNIINCTVENLSVASAEADAYIGGICGYNYANVINTSVSGRMESNVKNTVIGGIAAHNEGFIDEVSFKGSIETLRPTGISESVVGGICGYNSGGMIYNAKSSARITQTAKTVYSGGVAAIQSDGELYKVSSDGSINTDSNDNESVSYTGGIAGLTAGGILMHSHTDTDLTSRAVKSFSGGLVGYNEAAIIQNGYSCSDITQKNGFAGGICGFNEAGTIASTVAVNKNINTDGFSGRICAMGTEDGIYSNYALKMGIKSEGEGAFAGSTISETMLGYDFFTKQIMDGGKLGWSTEIWQDGGLLPTLK